MTPAPTERRGFTIVEIMVAILLLSVSLVAIFGAQFSAVAASAFSKHMTHVTQLAKCRMSELELEFQIDGFQETDVEESGDCCEFMEGDIGGDYTCRWEVKTIELPDPAAMMAAGGPDAGALDDLTGGMLGDEGGDMADMGMGMVEQFLPVVTDMLQQAIRRVTVTVEWEEGTKQRSFELMQYVVHPTQGPLQMMQDVNSMQQDAVERKGLESVADQMRPENVGGRNGR